MIYSYSSLGILQKCERRFALHYREDLRQNGPKPWALLRGSAWHALMAAEALQWGYEQGTLLHRPLELEIFEGIGPIPICEDQQNTWTEIGAIDVVEAIRQWEIQQESEYLDEMREEYGDLLSERLWLLWLRFADGRNKSELFGEPLLVEHHWTRELPNGLMAQGIVDLVYRDPVTDQIVVRDWKLHESWPRINPAVDDLVNSQNHFNAWGVAHDLRQITGDESLMPECVEYARARFKKPATPTLTKGTKNSPPRLAKSTTDFDAYTYSRWAHTGEVREGGYAFDEAFYEELKTQRDRWFRLSRKPLLYNVYSQHVLSAMRQAARAETITTEESVPSYSSDCGFCPFSALCRADLVGGRQPYDQIVPAEFGLRRKAENALH